VTADGARRSPLHGVGLPVGLRELPFLAQLDLRLDPADAAARAAVESVIGPLPLEPNTVHGGPDAAVVWLGPDEWLVVGPPDGAATLERQLRDALATGAPDASVALVDVSANRTTLELAHADARAILAGGCPIDLHPRAFGPGRCAQTLVARAGVILWQTADEPVATFRLLVRPSFAAYLAAWLTDAIGE
jgi:sarcosine oxidase, subunit gamma